MFAVKSGNDTPAVKLWQPAHSQGLDGSTGRRTMGREITRLELQLQQKGEAAATRHDEPPLPHAEPGCAAA